MPKSYKTCEIMQQEEYLTKEAIEAGLDHNAVKDYAYILHDKDTKPDGSIKAAHWHIMIRFKDSVPTESICKWFGIKENYINKIRGKFGDALAYLTHQNAPDKYQYLEENVISNFDFAKEVQASSSRAMDRKRKDEIIELIRSGIIREYNYTEYITVQEFDRYKKSIDNAFAYRRDTLTGLDRHMTVIYIYGPSGCGKTTYAKKLAVDKGFSCYVSSGSNDPLDGYKGQDCLILDDCRPWDYNVSDFLKLLDNNTQSTVKSRYKNKLLECQYLIVTTSLAMPAFFKQLLGSEGERLDQLERRCKLKISMENDAMSTYVYQPASEKYRYVSTLANPVAEQYIKKDFTDAECEQLVKDILVPGRPATLAEQGFKENPPRDVELAFETWHQEALHLEAKPNTKPIGH